VDEVPAEAKKLLKEHGSTRVAPEVFARRQNPPYFSDHLFVPVKAQRVSDNQGIITT
jgi:hypothetical protein